MKELLKKYLYGKKIFALFILTNLVYAFMLIVTIPRVMSYSRGMKLPDMMPTGYNAEYINSLLSVLGEKGRSAYLFNQLPVDMIYPFLFGITYSLLLAYILNKLGKLGGYLFYLCLLPLIAGLFDYFENFGLIAMLTGYPDFSKILASVTNIFSIMKSFLTTIYFFTLIVSLIALGINFSQKRNELTSR
jgi:hypothetical protein